MRDGFKGGWSKGSLSTGNALRFKALLNSSWGDDEPSIGELVGQLLVSTALSTVELLEIVSKVL
jgi:hypothetical protein